MRVVSAVVIAVSLVSSVAEGQVIQRPLRVYRGLFGASQPNSGGWEHAATLNLNGLGGFDTNLTPTSGDGSVTGGGGAGEAGARGSMAFAGAQAVYQLSKGQGLFEVIGNGYTNSFHGIGLQPVYGGQASIRISMPIGGRTSFLVSERYRDDPLFAPSVPAPFAIQNEPEFVAVVNDTSSYIARRTRATDGNLTLQHRLSSRDTVGLGAYHSGSDYEGGSGNNASFGGSATYSRALTRNVGLGADYTYSSSETQDTIGRTLPLENHATTLTYTSNHRISRTRQASFSVGGGTMYVDTISGVSGNVLRYFTPAANASFSMDLSRSWSLSTGYGRNVSVIEGLTFDSFVTNNLSLSFGGLITSRADVAISTAWVRGQAGAADAGTYDSYNNIAQIQLTVNRWLSTMLSYTFYTYNLIGATTVPDGVPASVNRHAVRVGLVLRLPLFGTFSEATVPRGGGR